MWLDRAVKWLLPREEHFFDLLERGADCALACADLLMEACAANNPEALTSVVNRMREVEHRADDVIHEVYDALNKTFVTPLDRSDIYALATDLETIVDCIHATCIQIVVHALDDLPEGSRELASQIHECCKLLREAVQELRTLKHPEEIRKRCKVVTSLEHEGDQVFRARLAAMFKHETDAIRLLKHKEFLEGLEETLDACDDVANALESVVIKNA